MTERLLENVVDEVLEKDAIDDFNNSKGQPKGVGLTNLVKGINECGIPFKAWYKKNADGSTSKILEYTSLVGAQKKKLLNTLPAKFHEYLNPDTCATVHKIWISFNDYSNLITDFKLSRDAGGEVFEEGKAWIEHCVMLDPDIGKQGSLHTCMSWLTMFQLLLKNMVVSKHLLAKGLKKIMMTPRECSFISQTNGMLQKTFSVLKAGSGN